jgi:hypothetical protein
MTPREYSVRAWNRWSARRAAFNGNPGDAVGLFVMNEATNPGAHTIKQQQGARVLRVFVVSGDLRYPTGIENRSVHRQNRAIYCSVGTYLFLLRTSQRLPCVFRVALSL